MDGNRVEADQWLVSSEKCLASGDFHKAKTFAIRACKADPSRADAADSILAISETLLAGESTIGDSKSPNWYAVLRLVPLTQNTEQVAIQFRRLALLLNPKVNRLPFSDQALKLVSDAWFVLSDSHKKSIYDQELKMSQIDQTHPQTDQFPSRQDSPLQSQDENSENHIATSFWTVCPYCFTLFEYPKGYEECAMKCQNCRRTFEAVETQTPPIDIDSNGESVYSVSSPLKNHMATSFWTACPYCFTLFEYPKSYEECAMKCQNCRRTFEAVKTQPPPISNGESVYCVSWTLFPLAFPGHAKTTASGSGWSPISHPMQSFDQEANIKAHNDVDIYVEISDDD